MEKVYKVYLISMQGIKSIVSCIKSSHVCLESTFPSKMLNFINVHIINARRSLACTIGGIRKSREVLDFCSAGVRHPDHTLITYPDLGHLFYPSSQWLTAAGPIEPKILEDLFGWLSDPVRDFKKLTILSSQIS